MKQGKIWVVILILICVAVLIFLKTTSNKNNLETSDMDISSNSNTTSSSLIIEDLRVGTGAEAVNGRTLSVHYVGTLENGTKFDSSRDRGTPFSFTLGQGRVIQGWEQGMLGMKVGGMRKLVIPSELGYGPSGMGPIPPNATLIFEVELLEIE